MRPRNQALMESRGRASSFRGNTFRPSYSRGRGQRSGGGRGSPSTAYRRTVEIAHQAGRGGPQAFARQPGRNHGYLNALYETHEEDQYISMMNADAPHSVTICDDGEVKNETPAAAAHGYLSSDRPNFSENF